ncbi:hypothetical protein G9A89_004819, partial [Geosiphon pyriformis]
KKKKKEENLTPTTIYYPYTYTQLQSSNYHYPKLECVNCSKKLLLIDACCGDNKEYQMATKFYCHLCLVEHFERPKQECETTFLEEEEYVINHMLLENKQSNIWTVVYMMITKFGKCSHQNQRIINLLNPEQFHKHYQELAPIRKEQEQCNCTLELESTFNSDLNSDNDDDENNSSSSAQYSNENNNNSDLDSNSKIYITLPDLIKEQELKWFSNNNKDIMPECAHNTNAEFDLRYLGKNSIKLKSYLCICIDFKIALKIPATTIVQLVSKSSLTKKEINIRGEIIDTEYIGNIIAMLQNDSEKAYIIDPNKKIAQTIFLFLVKIAQLVSKEIINKREIISTHQPISISPYDQYMVVIERKVKNQVQIFEAKVTLCESREIGLVNLHIPAKNHSHIKISIYNMKNMLLNNFNDIFASENKFGRTDIIQYQIKT